MEPLFNVIYTPLSQIRSEICQAGSQGLWHAGVSMRDPETIEEELVAIGAIADDSTKLERIIAWCASHPDEVPFALHQLLSRREKHRPEDRES